MSTQPTDAFDRTFPRREWFAGRGKLAWFLAVLNGLLLILLLLCGGLILGLLVDRGALNVTLIGDEIRDFPRVTGHEIPAPDLPDHLNAPDAADAGTPPGDVAETAEPVIPHDAPQVADEPVVVQQFQDHGILPGVWRARSTWWGALLATSYRRIPWLQTNVTALATLLSVFAVLWLLRVWCLAQLRGACRTVALETSTRLRRQLHRQSMRLATEDIDGHTLTEAITLFETEVDRVRAAVFEWLYRSTRYPLEIVSAVLAIASVELLLGVQWLLLTILAWYLVGRSQQQAERIRSQATDRADRELKSLAGSLRAARLIRGYNLEIQEQTQFQERLKRYIDAVHTQNRLQDDPLWLRLMVSLACAALASFLFFVWGAKVLAGEVTPAGAAVFIAAFVVGLLAVRELWQLPFYRHEVAVAGHKVWRYLDRLPTVSQAVGAKFLQPLSRALHIVDATYRLPGGRVLLDRMDIKLSAGRVYAVVSLDPLEAKSFVSLLPRFIEPQSGRVLFDGEDIAWGTLESIRAETVVVNASDPLLPGSVLDNIRAGQHEITLSQVTEAAKEARAHNFLSRLAQGYETVLDGQESMLDGGQRFRLSLARALLRKPAILILEEPAESLDEDTKQLLDDTYDRICPERTIFFLPQRLSTLKRADDILVLRGGQVAAMGPHSLLVKESPLYRHWEYVHFHEFRHDNATPAAS